MSNYVYEIATNNHAVRNCLAVRRDVFVLEQGIDEKLETAGDDDCVFFLGKHINRMHEVESRPAVATARIFPKEGGVAKIQRLAVLAEHRKHGVGAGLMRFMIEHARRTGYLHLELGSQVDAVGFYEKLGFEPFGDQYEEAGIMHQNMRLTF